MKRHSGFSLIELMIAIAIIAILAMLALPSYQSYVRDAKRSKAASCLMEYAQYMTQFRAAHMRFDKKVDGSAIAVPTLACSQESEIVGLYTFEFEENEPTASTFKVNAVPGDTDAECATLSIDHRGLRSISGTGTVDTCW